MENRFNKNAFLIDGNFGFPIVINLHLLMIISCANVFAICLVLFGDVGNYPALTQISLIMCCSIVVRSSKKAGLYSYQLRDDNKGMYRFFDSLFYLTICLLIFLVMASAVQLLVS